MKTIHTGQRTVELPGHISSLPQDVIDSLVVLPDASERVIACGVDPSDNSLYMISGLLDIRVIRPNGNLIPEKSFPSHDGKRMGIYFKDVEDLKTIDSNLALMNGESCLANASLFVNDTYMCNLEIDSLTEVAQGDR